MNKWLQGLFFGIPIGVALAMLLVMYLSNAGMLK